MAVAHDASVELVELVAKGMTEQIRHMPAEKAVIEIARELTFLAREYGARQEVPAETMAECIKLVRKKFGALSVHEIREAYRSWASGETEAKEMWGGAFNVSQLGSVLRAYLERRRKIQARITREVAELEEQVRAAQVDREAEMEAARQRFMNDQVAKLREKAESWRDVPTMYFTLARSLGLVELTTEAYQAIYREAEGHVATERKRLALVASQAERGLLVSIAAALAANVHDMNDRELQVDIARRMAFAKIFLGL